MSPTPIQRVQLVRPDGKAVEVELPRLGYSIELHVVQGKGQPVAPQLLIAQLTVERDYWKAKAEEYGGKLADLAARESGGG